MLNISFLACTKVELWDLIVCIAMPNIELVRNIFFFYDILKFCIHRSAKTWKHKNTETQKHTQTLTSTL